MLLTRCKGILNWFNSFRVVYFLIFISFYSDRSPRVEPPSFLKKIGDTEVYEGMKAKFTACATGWPDPQVEWFLNGQRVYPSDRTQIDVEPNGMKIDLKP